MIQNAISLALATVAVLGAADCGKITPFVTSETKEFMSTTPAPFSTRDFNIHEPIIMQPANMYINQDGAMTIEEAAAAITVSVKGHPSKGAVEFAKGFIDGAAARGEETK